MKIERWRSYLGDYAVSDRGRVMHVVTGRIRKLTLGANGYLTWTMHVNGSARPILVHRAVLECFVGPPSEGAVGRHLDGDRVNNFLENLAWGTQAENVRDTIRHGRQARGERSKKSGLTEKDVRIIRMSEESGKALALRYGVSGAAITAIRKRRTWAHAD